MIPSSNRNLAQLHAENQLRQMDMFTNCLRVNPKSFEEKFCYRPRQYYESKVLHNTEVTRFSTVHRSL